MKFLGIALLTQLAFSTLSFAQTQNNMARPHSGGNGGDDLELELKKRSLQIGYFLKSTVGTQTFRMLNADAVVETIENSDIDVVTGNVTDKYGSLRTCVNEPERALITCNLDRVESLIKTKKTDILTATLFHEILGLMGLELGYQDNVSMYPISSKIIPYTAIVESTVISEANIRPEYFGLDSRSYGVTVENKTTKETIRMICLNDNVEVNRCRQYSVVRKANGMQSPLTPSSVSITPAQLAKVNLENVKTSDLIALEAKLTKLQKRGFKYMSLGWDTKYCGYAYGVGAVHIFANYQGTDACWIGILALGIPVAIDTALEIPKQVGNVAIFPFKLIVNGIRSGAIKSKIKKANKNISVVRNILNLENKLSLVGTTRSVSDDEFNQITQMLQIVLTK